MSTIFQGSSEQRDDCAKASAAIANIRSKTINVVAGMDGFIDNIIDVVDTRSSLTDYQRLPTITSLGSRITAAAGESANLELVVKKSKIGGNGPIMCNASVGYGIKLTYIGILGSPQPHAVFKPMVDRAKEVITLGQPGVTDALEFSDGKIMMGKYESMSTVVTWETLMEKIGKDRLVELFSSCEAIVSINWTMTMKLTEIWGKYVSEILPQVKANGKRPIFFVDIADPAKRTRDDLLACCNALTALQEFVDVVFSINKSETAQCLEVLGLKWEGAGEDMEAARRGAKLLRDAMNIHIVQVHLKGSAAAASESEAVCVPGYYTLNPVITTGGGDHFNGGFLSSLLNGCSLSDCLRIGGATSGFYVRNAKSPEVEDTVKFLANLPQIDPTPESLN